MNAGARSLEALARTTLLIQRDIYPTLDDVTIGRSLTSMRAHIAASRTVAASETGQTALVTASILCMQMGMEVVLDFPEATVVSSQPPLRGEGLRESLLELSKELITPATIGTAGDFAISVGRDLGVARDGVAISGNDWGFTLKPSPAISSGFSGTLPFGPGLGATAASAEAFRFAMLRLGTDSSTAPLNEHPVRHVRGVSYRLPRFGYRPVDLGWVDSISAGALATSALYLLLRMPGLQMRLRVIDDDVSAISNLNRYLLLCERLLRTTKVEALKTYATAAIAIEPVSLRFDDATVATICPLASRLLVGVDDIPSRWLAQSVATGWVGIAATSHFEVVVSEHIACSPCASCLHPYDDPRPAEDIPTISFVSALSGFLLAHRLVRSACSGARPSQTLAYPFNLSGKRPVWDLPLAPHPACKVRCQASRELTTGRPSALTA